LFFEEEGGKKVEFFETEDYKEFELLKLARNSYYGVKVSYCNQIYNLCEKLKIDYNTFREHFTRCDWVEDQHTHVPGPDGKMGFGGKCLPKDTVALYSSFKERHLDFKMLKTVLEFNKEQRR
jgi:UDPglucose 6-dehydrogenase